MSYFPNFTASIVGPVTPNGYSADSTPLTGSPILIGAKIVDASTYAPAYSTTSVATFAIDKTSGAVLVSQGNLTPFADNVGIFGTDNVTWQAATVISASLSKSINTQVLVVQPVDANGNIITSSAGSTISNVTITSGNLNVTGSVTASILGNVNTLTTASIINTLTVNSHAVIVTSGNLNVTGSITASIVNTVNTLTTASIVNTLNANVTASFISTPTINSTASIINTVTVGSHAVTITSGNLNITGSVTASIVNIITSSLYGATFTSASSAKTGNTQVLMVQNIDSAGNIITASNITVTASISSITASIINTVNTAVTGNVTVGGNTYYVTSSFTRTPNTTPYVAGDVVCTASIGTNILPNCARIVGGSGTILNAKLVDSNNHVSTSSYEAYIFNANRTSEADNAPFSASVVDSINTIAVIPFASSYIMATGSSVTVLYTANNLLQPFVCAAGTSSLYYNLVVKNNYTASSAESYTLILGILVD